MIFVDSNIPMYLIGDSPSHQAAAKQTVEGAIFRQERLVTSAEVLQEILHRYVAIRRPDAIQAAFDVLLGIVDEVYPVELPDVQRAKTIVMSRKGLTARDAVHVAVMERHSVSRVMSFDQHFDLVPAISRVPSADA